jgi:hypothetical protein
VPVEALSKQESSDGKVEVPSSLQMKVIEIKPQR